MDAVLTLDEDLDMDMIGIKKVAGGAVEDSFFVKGVAFKKSFSYAGFEQQPKTFKDPKVHHVSLQLKGVWQCMTSGCRLYPGPSPECGAGA